MKAKDIMSQHEREKQQADGQEAGVSNVAQPFGKMLFSMAPNGMIGCLEFLILNCLSFIVILGVIVSGGLLSAAMPVAANAYGAGGFGIFAFISGMGTGLCWLAGLVVGVLFSTRLLQLRLIDIGLGKNLSVPGVCANFWVCLLISVACSLLTLPALILFIFCCVCQGKTYADNRDVFKPVPPVPPADEIGEKMHRRK